MRYMFQNNSLKHFGKVIRKYPSIVASIQKPPECEIGRGYLVWIWIRDHKPFWHGGLGGIIFALYSVIAALQIAQ